MPLLRAAFPDATRRHLLPQGRPVSLAPSPQTPSSVRKLPGGLVPAPPALPHAASPLACSALSPRSSRPAPRPPSGPRGLGTSSRSRGHSRPGLTLGRAGVSLAVPPGPHAPSGPSCVLLCPRGQQSPVFFFQGPAPALLGCELLFGDLSFTPSCRTQGHRWGDVGPPGRRPRLSPGPARRDPQTRTSRRVGGRPCPATVPLWGPGHAPSRPGWPLTMQAPKARASPSTIAVS